MNRKQRRASEKQRSAGLSGIKHANVDNVRQLHERALRHQQLGELNVAAQLYKRAIARDSDNVETLNNLGLVHLALGQTQEAARRFEQALMLVPQVADNFQSILPTLYSLNAALAGAARRAASAWPQRLSAQALLGTTGFDVVASDRLLLRILSITTIRDVALEHLFTSLRFDILHIAVAASSHHAEQPNFLEFCAALAKQCFINEYVFAQGSEETAQATHLKDKLNDALAAHATVPMLWPLAVAMYFPLHTLPQANALLERTWPPVLDTVLVQQIREPSIEQEYRDTIPRLTSIDDAVSVQVRQQYEENPYPRWVRTAAIKRPLTLGAQMNASFPSASFKPFDESHGVDILVAGCGTGKQAIEVAQGCKNARVLAIDLSLTSLCYAKRKTPKHLAHIVEYGQADIRNLATLGRTFDCVVASGVLHHMADVLMAWREILALVRPGGLMFLGLYSEIARRELTAARAFIAEKGYQSTADDIRRCRQNLLQANLKGVQVTDFFSTSTCRDLLFHVKEHHLTIPQIKSFIEENRLKFIGFSFESPRDQQYRSLFTEAGWPLDDLDRWHDFEVAHPESFAAMYQFWVQKT